MPTVDEPTNTVIGELNAGEVVVPLGPAGVKITPLTTFTTSTSGNVVARATYVDPTNDDDDDDDDDEEKAEDLADDAGYGGVMVAFTPIDPELYVVDGGDPAEQLHVTLCYLGTEEDVTDGAQQLVRDATLEIAGQLTEFDAEVCGVGVLGSDDAVVVLVESQTFADVKADLAERLKTIEPRGQYPHFVPHMTLGYGLPTDVIGAWRDRIGETIRIGGLRAAFGESNYDYNLKQPSEEAERMTDTETNEAAPVVEPASTDVRDRRPLDVACAQRSVSDELKADHRRLPEPVLARLRERNEDVGILDRVGRALCEMRFQPEIRRNKDGTVGVHGYATVYDYAYDVADGPASGGWSETISVGACDKSVSDGADVRFLVNHDGIALARTRSKTMALTSDEHGLYVDVPTLDVRSPLVQSLLSAMERGDMDEMSFAFKAIRQEWNEDYTQRWITEAKLYDASVVTYPANPATVVTLHTDKKSAPPADAYPLDLALAELDGTSVRGRVDIR